jgi:Ca-activated chloride channel family protein
VYSPSHPVDIERPDETQAIAGYEAQNVRPDSDFSLFYSLGESEAFHLFSYRDPTDSAGADGFFLLLLAPRPEAQQERIAKDVLLVLDRSGSMDGEKFQQAQAALRYILKQLGPGDRFHLLSFSTGIDMYAPELRPAEDANEAIAWVDGLSAAGSTDINRALLESVAVMDRERPTYLIFLTDGLPTEGVVDSQEILKNFAAAAPANLRLFSFGVGYDVDTVLLDSLAQEHHGLSSYVGPGQALDEVLSGFYERISTPVLTNLALDFGGLAVYDLYPNPLPDLFAGNQVVVVGRYRDGGTANVTLSGQTNQEQHSLLFEDQVFAKDSRGDTSGELIPRLWATRKIGYLLNQVRINGADKELIDQIVRLSIRYGIVTPYTSYLVTDELPLGAQSQERIVEDAFKSAAESPAAPSGQSAVERAAQEGALKGADVAPAPDILAAAENDSTGQTIRIAGSRTFVLQDGIWMDTTYDPQGMQVEKLAFLSPDYYQLLSARPDLGAALALGQQVLVVVEGVAYQVVPEDQASGPIDLPPTVATQPAPVNTPTSQTATRQPDAATETPARPKPAPTGQPGLCFSPLAVVFLPVAVIQLSRRRARRVS